MDDDRTGDAPYEAQRGRRATDRIAADAGRIASFAASPFVVGEVEILVVAYEVRSVVRFDLLPPALNPTVPSIVTWVVLSAQDSAVGPFRMAEMRVSCRAALRPRAYVTRTVINSEAAADVLSTGWGYQVSLGDVEFRSGYASRSARVVLDGACILDLSVAKPVLLHQNDPFWVADMVPAQTADGLCLVQCEWEHDITQAERVVPTVRTFEPSAWSDPPVSLTQPVAGLVASGTTSLPPARYVCDPTVAAQLGTRRLANQGSE